MTGSPIAKIQLMDQHYLWFTRSYWCSLLNFLTNHSCGLHFQLLSLMWKGHWTEIKLYLWGGLFFFLTNFNSEAVGASPTICLANCNLGQWQTCKLQGLFFFLFFSDRGVWTLKKYIINSYLSVALVCYFLNYRRTVLWLGARIQLSTNKYLQLLLCALFDQLLDTLYKKNTFFFFIYSDIDIHTFWLCPRSLVTGLFVVA